MRRIGIRMHGITLELRSDSMRRIGIRMHGITLELRSDSEALLGYVACLMRDVTCAPAPHADVVVTARWATDVEAEAAESASPAGIALEGWRDRDLRLGFHREDGTHHFDVLYRYRPSEKKVRNHPDHLHRKQFELLRFVVLYPIAWLLERRHSWVLMHGAALSGLDGRGVLLVGAGGAGKTTTAMAVARRTGMTVLGENLLLWDGTRLHGIAEPARAESASIALADPASAGLERVDLPGGSGKLLYRLAPMGAAGATRPGAVFLLDPGAPAGARRMSPLEAHERLLAVHRLATEIKDFDTYTATLDLAWPEPGHAEALRAQIALLARTTPAYQLGVDRTAGIEATVENLLDALGNPQEAQWTPR